LVIDIGPKHSGKCLDCFHEIFAIPGYVSRPYTPSVFNLCLKSPKFAGKPWLSAGEQYPTCPNCKKPMEFIFQLNLEELPVSLHNNFGKGLVQLFYCFEGDCDCVCAGWEAFSPVQVARIIQPKGDPAEFEIPERGERHLARIIEGPIPAKLPFLQS
jgi:hypothetical protein